MSPMACLMPNLSTYQRAMHYDVSRGVIIGSAEVIIPQRAPTLVTPLLAAKLSGLGGASTRGGGSGVLILRHGVLKHTSKNLIG